MTYGQLAALIGMLVIFGQGFFFIGRLWQRVTTNERNIQTIFDKIDDISKFVRNGRTSQ